MSNEGLNIAILHVLGVPLVQSQSDLTFLQSLFLFYALPRAHKHLTASKEDNSSNLDELKYEMKRRQT